MDKRMTWDEIEKTYPDKWVGLSKVEWDENPPDVRSAVVEYVGDSGGDALRRQIAGEDMYTTYTTPNNLCPLGVLVGGELMYPELPIIAAHIGLPCQMLLSATMFSGLIYEVDDCNHRFNVTIPDHESHVRKLTIEDRNGNLHILCTGEHVE